MFINQCKIPLIVCSLLLISSAHADNNRPDYLLMPIDSKWKTCVNPDDHNVLAKNRAACESQALSLNYQHGIVLPFSAGGSPGSPDSVPKCSVVGATPYKCCGVAHCSTGECQPTFENDCFGGSAAD